MLRLTIALLAALAILTACDSEEDIPSATTTVGEGLGVFQVSPTPAGEGEIVICPRIGVLSEAGPSSPTPEPSCEPGDDLTSTPDIRGHIAEPPAIPSGAFAMTQYIEFETGTPESAVTISLPLLSGNSEESSDYSTILRQGELNWYSYSGGEWERLDVTPTIHRSTITSQTVTVSGQFDPVPPNLILLATP